MRGVGFLADIAIDDISPTEGCARDSKEAPPLDFCIDEIAFFSRSRSTGD